MPKVKNVRRKLTSFGYIRDMKLSSDPIIEKKVDPQSGKPYALGIPGCDYWVDCIGNGRDIRYGWGADGSDWVSQLSVLSKKKMLTDPGQKLKTWLEEKFFKELSSVPNGYPSKRNHRLSEIEDLDNHGRQIGSISKAIQYSRLGR